MKIFAETPTNQDLGTLVPWYLGSFFLSERAILSVLLGSHLGQNSAVYSWIFGYLIVDEIKQSPKRVRIRSRRKRAKAAKKHFVLLELKCDEGKEYFSV